MTPRNPSSLRLSAELLALSQAVENSALTLEELMQRLQGRVYTLLLVLLSLPFCQPISLPGLSTPFGVVIALLGLRYALRKQPWLPRRVLNTKIPSRFLPRILKFGGRLLAALERFLHPRLVQLFEYRVTQFMAGAAICVSGLLLLLPLPIPFSNLLPALTVILIAASVSERDGATLAFGGLFFLLTIAFFVAIFWGGTEVIGWLKEHFSGIFEPDEQIPDILPLDI